MGIKSLTNWKSYSQSQLKWPYNHDLKSLACTHDLKRIGIAKSVKISTLLSNHFPNQFLYARLRELHNWNFRIFKKRWQIFFFSWKPKLDPPTKGLVYGPKPQLFSFSECKNNVWVFLTVFSKKNFFFSFSHSFFSFSHSFLVFLAVF